MNPSRTIRGSAKSRYRRNVAASARQLSGKELGLLARRMVNAKGERKKTALREALIRGFYGRS